MSSDENKLNGMSLGLIPQLKDDGSNWWDFFRRLEETLTMGGFADTMQQSKEPYCPSPPVNLLENGTEAQQTAQLARHADYTLAKAEYNRTFPIWAEKQGRACMAIRSKCEYNNYQKVKSKTRVYQMLDVLRAGREKGSGKLMELTTRFYALHLADCKSIADFSGQLLQINHELQDLHPSTAFSEVQLVLRFLQGLGSTYDIFITTLTQSAALITSADTPAISFDSVVQKAYNEEKRQSSSITGAGTALVAHSRPSGTVDHCTHCNKDRHTEAKCFLKHPYLKKEFDDKRKARDKKRKRTSGGRGDFKKPKSSSSSSSSEQITDISDTGALTVSCIAIDTFVSGNITSIPTDNQAFSASASAGLLQNEWIADTGCTNHCTGVLANFSDLRKGQYGTCGGIGGSVRFEGIGTVEIPIPGPGGRPTLLRLTDVKYCPSMGPFNLISVSQIFKGKKARPILTEEAIYWTVGKVKINASAKHGLWLLDQAK
jgi:gag-polypeptide of LTR copia-type